ERRTDELAIPVVVEELLGLARGDPAHLVDLVLRPRIARRAHPVVPHLLRPGGHVVVGAPHLRPDDAAQPGLLLDLARRGLFPALALLELPLRQRPVAVAGA